MRLLRFIPIKITLCLIPGILFGHYYQIGITPALTSTIMLSFLLLFLFVKRPKSNFFIILVGLTTVSTGILSTALKQAENYSDHYLHENFKSEQIWHLKIREVMKPTSFSIRYIAEVKGIKNQITTGKILLNYPRDTSKHTLQVDDEIFIHEKIEEISPPLNPHQFNYRSYMKGLGITHQMKLNASNHVIKQNPTKTIYGRASRLRNMIINTLQNEHFGKEELSIIQALLLGQRHDITQTTYDNYKNAGAVHILAVSGLHIGILLLLLQWLLRPLEYLPKGKTIKLITIVLLLWGFAFLSGLSASVIRAVTMFTFVAYAMYLNRPSNTFNILALSIIFILLVINPLLLFQVGFQMSYAAVLAIAWIYPMLQKAWYPKNPITRYIWQLLSVSVAAQLGVIPISLYYFHQFPGLFFISNILIVPFLGVILGLGILVIVLALMNLLPDFLITLYNFLIGQMNVIIGWIGKQEIFIFKNIPFDHIQMILAYIIILGLVTVLSKPNFKRTMIFLIAMVTFQSWLLYTTYDLQDKEQLFVAHQTGNSILIYRGGEKLTVFSYDMDRAKKVLNDYQISERIDTTIYRSLKNSYNLENKTLFIVDSLATYSSIKTPTDYLLLTQSPKLNLERLIDSLKPKVIIADGSNYNSLIKRWKQSCKKRKLPFHYTGEKGAYYFNLEN